MSEIKAWRPSWVYFVWDARQKDDDENSFAVFYGNPDIFAEENEASRMTWHVMHMGMSEEAANAFCKSLNEYPYDLKRGDRVKVKSVLHGIIPEHDGRIATVKEFQYNNGTIVILSDEDENEEIIEFGSWCYPTELTPYFEKKMTDEELYFSTFV
jgi:hypothetical protein